MHGDPLMAYLLKRISRGFRGVSVLTRSCSNGALAYSDEVRQAKAEGRPVVALESTIITHGMPYPHNLETALLVEAIIRERGATPATVAILKGQLTVGLTPNQLEYLATAKGVVKASRRDLAPVVANAKDGATTVAGTIIAAELADIPIFVTGGIGGVHRGGEHTLDMSADLNELGRCKTMVVCSGVKSILDIGRTLEYLETQGVCVCAFGANDDFPAFYTPRSGHRAPHRVASALQAAQMLRAARVLRLTSGVVVAVPVPSEHAMDDAAIEDAIKIALDEADTKGIHGKEVTPFILSAVAKVTGGSSLATNIALIKNNAKVGADIAVQYCNLNKSENHFKKSYKTNQTPNKREFHTSALLHSNENLDEVDSMFGPHRKSDANILVIGGSNVDRTYRVEEDRVQLDGSTHACAVEQSGGGVGRNMAEALWRLRGRRARLLTALGDDADGDYLSNIAPGLMINGCVIRGRTPTYAAVLDSRGECVLGLGDMGLHQLITKELVDRHMEELEQAPIVVLDGNVPQETTDYVLRLCHQLGKPVFFEPTDRRKAVKTIRSGLHISYSSPNLSELHAMASYLQPTLELQQDEFQTILKLSKIVSEFVDFLIITLGAKGVLTVRKANTVEPKVRQYPVKPIDGVVNVSGAGDCFASGFIHGILLGYEEAHCVSIGYECAKQALLSRTTVPVNLKLGSFYKANFTIINVAS